ncbi:50S ribosomal protein L25/general stress protein Ctc [Aquibaculum arenosum]|uniref:Large ribosomal subunit protein bL25 n=1 Tax=Aquibaculum arenosum TaxID=3032591 RepID=A0ABT5YL18_9PROT|nr:50S ribosomal protein L25/general stress protein Ctc [Fodinicurvata sp. CAU 1616]MDF2094959.1 50S ribosomal protein L25/general stress protein Ctc [Fodinicurvata sp. CAU 1616]
MSETVNLPAELRDRAGKGTARAARRAGRVPAVIYGAGKDPVSVTIETRLMKRELNRPGFFARLFTIEVGGKKEQVLPRDLQMHPIKEEPLHFDFLRVSKGSTVSVAVPVRFLNEETSPGLKRGGVLNIVRHDVEVDCSPNAIPEHIDVDLSEADIGDSLHISGVKLAKGVTPTISDRDFTIATIVAPSAVKAEAAEEEEGAEAAESTEAAEE